LGATSKVKYCNIVRGVKGTWGKTQTTERGVLIDVNESRTDKKAMN